VGAVWAKGKDIVALLGNAHEVFPLAPTFEPPLTRSSTPAQIRQAYMKAVRVIHPDKIGPTATLEQRLIAHHLFTIISEVCIMIMIIIIIIIIIITSMKAVRVIHPDKIGPTATLEQRLIAHHLFTIISEVRSSSLSSSSSSSS
jgi:glyoxylate carboligase